MFSFIALLSNVGLLNIIVVQEKLSLNPNLLVQLFKHQTIITSGPTECELNVE